MSSAKFYISSGLQCVKMQRFSLQAVKKIPQITMPFGIKCRVLVLFNIYGRYWDRRTSEQQEKLNLNLVASRFPEI